MNNASSIWYAEIEMIIIKRLNQEQRGRFAEKLMDWGNLVFVGLVIGQIVPGTAQFRFSMFFLGIVCIVAAYLTSYYLTLGGESKT